MRRRSYKQKKQTEDGSLPEESPPEAVPVAGKQAGVKRKSVKIPKPPKGKRSLPKYASTTTEVAEPAATEPKKTKRGRGKARKPKASASKTKEADELAALTAKSPLQLQRRESNPPKTEQDARDRLNQLLEAARMSSPTARRALGGGQSSPPVSSDHDDDDDDDTDDNHDNDSEPRSASQPHEATQELPVTGRFDALQHLTEAAAAARGE
jgi:hypothetical protein